MFFLRRRIWIWVEILQSINRRFVRRVYFALRSARLAYTDKLTKEFANQLQAKLAYFLRLIKLLFTTTMDRLSWHRFLCLCLTLCLNVEFRKIEMNRYKLSQVAD